MIIGYVAVLNNAVGEIGTNQSTGSGSYTTPSTQANEAAAFLHHQFYLLQLVNRLLVGHNKKHFEIQSKTNKVKQTNFFK